MTTIFALILAVATASPVLPRPVQQAAAPVDTNALVEGIDRTFASMKDFQARFIQISKNSVNQSPADEGHLYLTRDKKMRVDYEKPEEKYFISNGKTLFTYIPANRQITKDPVTDSMSEQFPLMFLIGRSGLRKEFKEVRLISNVKPLMEGDQVLLLTPNRKSQDIDKIEIEVNPRTFLIDRMTILNTDKASTDFAFLEIEINSNIPASKFEFTPPPGIRVIQGGGIPSGIK